MHLRKTPIFVGSMLENKQAPSCNTVLSLFLTALTFVSNY
jgi:hypothetical protein